MQKSIFPIFLVSLVLISLIGGCGAMTFDETAYYSPNWTPEGLIYTTKVVTHYKTSGRVYGLVVLKRFKLAKILTM